MKKKSSLIKIAARVACVTTILTNVEAQTVLSGDHVVEGDLEVGTAIQRGGITVTGGTGNAASPGIKVTGDGGVLFEGTSGVGVIPTEGQGTRMMWYPKKAAFRVGALQLGRDGYWNDEKIGFSSVAFGNAAAIGDYSTAIGGGYAEGNYSTAISDGYAWGESAVAATAGLAAGNYSTAMGLAYAEGTASVAMSQGTAFGDWSTAMSYGRTEGISSIAGGAVVSKSYQSVVFGSYNVVDENESVDEWVETDSIFVVGNGFIVENGTGDENDPPEVRYRNAFVILKNGTIRIPKRQGDILMGEFGNPEL